MKKNFFKKLSFVMALAMVLSTLAPAASAFSATAPSINVAKKYLYLNEEGKISEYDFNIKDKVAGSTYAWASDNEAVAEVDAATGLTVAKAVGTAHITVTITLKDGTTKDLKATVVVRDNIETIDVSNVPTTDVAVNKEYDFNRSFVTFNGSTTKTSSISRWTVDKTTATIAADSGKFTATQAGEYQVTVNAFQSAAQYDAWLVSKDATLVKATKTVKVTVSASVVSTVQVDSDTFKVTFDSDMSKTDLSKTTAVLYQVISGKNVSTGTEKIKELKLDATGKVATVDLYAAVSAGTVYNFVYGKLTGTFTAAKKDIANIAGIVVDDFNVAVTGPTAGEDFVKHVKAVDANGVVIYDGSVTADATAISGYMSYSYGTSDTTKGNYAGGKVYIYSEGYAATVSATFTNYVYDTTAKAYKAVTYTDSAIATGITAGAITVGSLQFGLGSATSVAADYDADSEWKGNLTVPAGESAKIWVRYYTNTSTSTYVYTQPATYTYTSADTNKLLITGTSLYPISSGTVTVIVKDSAKDNAVVGTFDVVIVGGRTFASATQDVGTLTVGNNHDNFESAKATVTLTDSLGAAVAPGSVTETISFVNKPSGASDLSVTPTELTGDNTGKVELLVTARDAVAGYYNLKVTFDAFNVKKDVYFTVIVTEANTAATTTVASWAIDLSDLDVDKKANFAEDVTVRVFGYNAAGMRVAELVYGSEFTLDVTNSNNTSVASGAATFTVVTSGAPVTAWDNGTYTVTVNLKTAGINKYFAGSGRVDGSFLAAKAFVVSDTTTKSFSIENATVVPGTLLAVVQSAFNYKINGNDATEANISSVTYSVGAASATVTGNSALTSTNITSGQNIFVEKVTIQLIDAGRTINVEIPVGVTIAVR